MHADILRTYLVVMFQDMYRGTLEDKCSVTSRRSEVLPKVFVGLMLSVLKLLKTGMTGVFWRAALWSTVQKTSSFYEVSFDYRQKFEKEIFCSKLKPIF